MNDLPVNEQQKVQEQAEKLVRSSLLRKQPQPQTYLMGESRAVRITRSTLMWSRFSLLIIAIFAATASSIRTIQAVSEIYTAAGSHPIGVALAAIAFTVAVEGALFVLALAQEGDHLKQRAKGTPRRVMSLKSVWQAIQVRIGLRDPLGHDELDDGGGFGLLVFIAAAFAVVANMYLGFRPLLSQIGDVSLQTFFATLWSAPAHLQLTFLLDGAGTLFPPLMALAAGHLTARFAAEIAQESQGTKLAFERDMEVWREAYANPLETDEGQLLLERLTQERIQAKAARKTRQAGSGTDFLAPTPHSNGTKSHSEMG